MSLSDHLPAAPADRPPASRGATAAAALALAALAASCGGGPLHQLGDQLPASGARGQVLASPATAPVTTAAPPVMAPGPRGGPGAPADSGGTAPAPPPEATATTAARAGGADGGRPPSSVTAAPGREQATGTTTAQLAARLDELNATDATLFKPDTTTLDQDAISLLDRVAAELRAHPGVRVEVAGHTDTNGTPDSNQRISQARAEAVRDHLVSEGIDAARLVATGYGQTRPRATNDTVEGRALNRRIEFNVLG